MESTQKQFDHGNGNYILDHAGPKKELKKIWNRSFEAQSAPFVYEGILYVSTDGFFHAINPENGNTIWKFETPGRATSPVFYEDLLIFGGYYLDSNVYALNKNSGKEIWKYKTGPSTAPVKRTPVINNDSLYVSAGKTIHCLSILTGKKQWTFNLKKKTGNTNMIINADQIYAVTQDAPGKEELQCIDIHSKELVWKIKTPNLSSNLICAEGYLFYLNTEAELCEVNRTTGETIKSKILSFNLINRVGNGSLTYNNGILVITLSSYILGLNLTANPWSWQWNFKAKAEIGRPVITHNEIYFATMGDGIYALDLITGKQLFHKDSEVRSDLACGISDSQIFVAGSMSEHELAAYGE